MIIKSPAIITSKTKSYARMQTPPNPSPAPARPTQTIEDFYIYQADFATGATNGPIAAAGAANANIQIQADSDFRLTKLAMMADIALAAVTEGARIIPLVTLALQDTGSGRQLFSSPVPLGSIFGEAGLPFILPVPRIFRARSAIALSLLNYSAATTYNIRLSFIGNKIFALG